MASMSEDVALEGLQTAIMALLRGDGARSIDDLAVSTMTLPSSVRKALHELSEQGYVRRVSVEADTWEAIA